MQVLNAHNFVMLVGGPQTLGNSLEVSVGGPGFKNLSL